MFAKFSKQIVIYSIEIFLMSSCVAWILINYFNILQSLDCLEQLLIGYTIYQMLVYVILSTIDDVHRDSAVAYLSFLKYVELNSNYKNRIFYDKIKKIANEMTNKSVFLDKKIANEMEFIAENLESIDVLEIKKRIIDIECMIMSLDQKWRLSFLLRLFK